MADETSAEVSTELKRMVEPGSQQQNKWLVEPPWRRRGKGERMNSQGWKGERKKRTAVVPNGISRSRCVQKFKVASSADAVSLGSDWPATILQCSMAGTGPELLVNAAVLHC